MNLKAKLPIIFSVMSLIGTGIGSYLSYKAGRRIECEEPFVQNPKEKAKLYLRQLAAPALVTAGSIVLGACSTVLSVEQTRSFAAAYVMGAEALRNYKKAAIDVYGEDADERITQYIMAEKAEDISITAPTFMETTDLSFEDANEKPSLFYDSFGEKYFESTLSRVLIAEYHLNRNYSLIGEISINDFYDFLGLEKEDWGDALGWNMDSGIYWIDISHKLVMIDDGPGNEVPCYVITFPYGPYADFDKDYCLYNPNIIDSDPSIKN